MRRDIAHTVLSDEQKGQICGILSVGCDRETAANFVGCPIATIGRLMQQDPKFATNIRRTEAGTELAHMRNVQEAAKEAKNWRASVWWLERHSPERFGRRGAGVVTFPQLEAFMEIVAGVLIEEIHDLDDQQHVLTKLKRSADMLRETIRLEAPHSVSPMDASPDDLPGSYGDE
ncbi:MAG TPA: hypothetical protein VFW73_06710 [Lacipirellulaceae bacterium]|nr:hypothetical protein [Lacipirellulaceae bacterium]